MLHLKGPIRGLYIRFFFSPPVVNMLVQCIPAFSPTLTANREAQTVYIQAPIPLPFRHVFESGFVMSNYSRDFELHIYAPPLFRCSKYLPDNGRLA